MNTVDALAAKQLEFYRAEYPGRAIEEPWFSRAFGSSGFRQAAWPRYWNTVRRLAEEVEHPCFGCRHYQTYSHCGETIEDCGHPDIDPDADPPWETKERCRLKVASCPQEPR